ncbi:MAG: hypothetical protein FWD31_08185, partial [Planctomycetaceae bacterium]|nr:hypothetical protein [Planctomycetaceae bacterium]
MTNFYLVKINPMAFLRLCLSTLLLLMMTCSVLTAGEYPETSGGWDKYENNPVLGGDLGTCFDVTMLHEDGLYQMWFSWRPRKSIAYTESRDGINWKEPVIVLGPRRGWESDLNRPGIIKKDGLYHLWYTGQANGRSNLGYATSEDGMDWERKSNTPVLIPEEPWEKVAVMCPHVEWDAQEQIFKMWYSGGEQYEPNAIGYATSKDGLSWDKRENNPVFIADKKSPWEQHKVTAAQVFKHDDWYLMFYIGFEDEDHARIGVARSRDGITNWQRHPTNPIIAPTLEKWDHDACYKPFVLFDHEEKKWRLWYNGRRGGSEQIGFAWHDGEDLGFPDEEEEETVKKTGILQPEQFKHYIDTFNNDDNELIVQAFPNDVAWNFLSANIPFLDYPDKNIEKTYYFRWWTFRKHLKKTDAGFVITEFQPPVPWAGKENTISCPGGHHFREGRWLHDPQF